MNWLAEARQGLWQVLPLAAAGERELSLFFYFCFRWKSAPDQPGAPRRPWMDRSCVFSPASLIKWGQIDYGQVRATKTAATGASGAKIFCSMPRGMHDLGSMRSAPRIPGGWKILSFTTLYVDRYGKEIVGTNGRANWHGVSPLL